MNEMIVKTETAPKCANGNKRKKYLKEDAKINMKR
jgi:hypothetical protein